MDDLDRLTLQAEISNWKSCLLDPVTTNSERRVLHKLIADAEKALKTDELPRYKKLKIDEVKHDT